jgi:hypothetical protein
MGHSKTSTAGQRSGRGNPLLGRAAFVVTASALAFGLAAWIVGFDPLAALRGPALANGSAALSFDDRFGSRSTISSASIYYPSRRGVPSPRGDFKSEFEQIEGMLTSGQLHDTQTDQPSPPPASTTVAAIPLPRSRPVEADLALRNDPPPQALALAAEDCRPDAGASATGLARAQRGTLLRSRKKPRGTRL